MSHGRHGQKFHWEQESGIKLCWDFCICFCIFLFVLFLVSLYYLLSIFIIYIFYSLSHIYVFTYFALIVCCGLKFTERRKTSSINSSLLHVLGALCGSDILVLFLSCFQGRMIIGWAVIVVHSWISQVSKSLSAPLWLWDSHSNSEDGSGDFKWKRGWEVS